MSKSFLCLASLGLALSVGLSADVTGTASSAKNDAPGSLKAGNRLLIEGKYADALACFNAIGEQSADNGKLKREPYRQLDLATAYLQLGKYRQSEDAASKAIALNKDIEAAWADLAVAQGKDGHRDTAMDTDNKGIALLKADHVDTSRLESNLEYLKSWAAKKKAPKKPAAGGASAAAVSGTTAISGK